MATTRIYVPRETAAVSLGADEVALEIAREAKARSAEIRLVRNGSWGATWMEPLVEVETEGNRIAYANVAPNDVAGLFAAGFLEGGDHERRVGDLMDVPYLADQDRWTYFRCGLIDPLSIDEFMDRTGFAAIRKSFEIGADAVIDAVTESGLRGRGGAAFPTGIKWRTVADTDAEQKYIACNADEGDSGTFSDRMLMECDPFCLIESMLIAGYAVATTFHNAGEPNACVTCHFLIGSMMLAGSTSAGSPTRCTTRPVTARTTWPSATSTATGTSTS